MKVQPAAHCCLSQRQNGLTDYSVGHRGWWYVLFLKAQSPNSFLQNRAQENRTPAATANRGDGGREEKGY